MARRGEAFILGAGDKPLQIIWQQDVLAAKRQQYEATQRAKQQAQEERDFNLNKALDDQRIEYGYLPSLLVQVVGHGQVVGTRRFHHEQAVRPTDLHQLLEADFAIADF
ncbi:hypothetical protein SD425_24015 [Hymenobacter sp. GOD-10R]|nr:hypothetical protein [Hymenobacter sp. GOD-10R]WRQ28135.1 hypothetical protein SD425_24015 [Hymenobacter sp. GOD-10R]